MRMLLIIRLPNEAFNAAVRDGTAGPKTQAILEETKPEAVWFTEMKGQRTVVMVAEVDRPASIPRLADPGFLPSMPKWNFMRLWGSKNCRKPGSMDWARNGDKLFKPGAEAGSNRPDGKGGVPWPLPWAATVLSQWLRPMKAGVDELRPYTILQRLR